MERPHTEISIWIQLHQTLTHSILHHISYFVVDTRAPNRHYTIKRLSWKRNQQSLYQQMEGTNEGN